MNPTTTPASSRFAGTADTADSNPGTGTGTGRISPDWISPVSPLRRVPTAGMDAEPRALSDREKQILRLICDGLSNAEIAVRLGLSSETVKADLKRIFRKIDVKNRTQAAVRVVRQGLV